MRLFEVIGLTSGVNSLTLGKKYTIASYRHRQHARCFRKALAPLGTKWLGAQLTPAPPQIYHYMLEGVKNLTPVRVKS